MPCFLITLSLCLFPCLLQSVRNFVSVFIAVTPLKPMSSLFRRFGYFLCFPFSLILVVLLCLSLSVRACFCLYVRPVVPGTAHVKTVRVNVRACEQKRFFLTASDRLWSSSLSLSFSVSLYVCVCVYMCISSSSSSSSSLWSPYSASTFPATLERRCQWDDDVIHDVTDDVTMKRRGGRPAARCQWESPLSCR